MFSYLHCHEFQSSVLIQLFEADPVLFVHLSFLQSEVDILLSRIF